MPSSLPWLDCGCTYCQGNCRTLVPRSRYVPFGVKTPMFLDHDHMLLLYYSMASRWGRLISSYSIDSHIFASGIYHSASENCLSIR